MGQPALVPPVRCARCRSPLWNTPRQYKLQKRERERADKADLLAVALDRDSFERLYRAQKSRCELAEAEVKQLRQDIKEDGKVIDAYEKDIRSLESRLRMKEKQILELLGQRRLIK
jgi:chromosome segregation ATPase